MLGAAPGRAVVSEWPAPLPFWPPAPPDLLPFVSGASAPADLRGLLRFSVPVGVSVPDLSAPALEYLLAQAQRPLVQVFVDSGAFGEVEVVDGTLRVVAPITESAWAHRVDVALRVARAFGSRALVVAPDRVGNQDETLVRLRRWSAEMALVRATGARIVVPLQRGDLSTAAFEREAASALGFADFTSGIPGNKEAMPAEELEAYLRACRPRALHLLGVGPRSRRLPALLNLCRRLIPGVRVSCDSNALAALVGRSNGRGGGPRCLTAQQAAFAAELGEERAREEAIAMIFGPSHLYALWLAEVRRQGAVAPYRPGPIQAGLFDMQREDVACAS